MAVFVDGCFNVNESVLLVYFHHSLQKKTMSDKKGVRCHLTDSTIAVISCQYCDLRCSSLAVDSLLK